MNIALRQSAFSAKQVQALLAVAKEANVTLDVLPLKEKVTLAQLSKYDALLGYYPTDLLAKLPHLRWVQSPSAGVESLCAISYTSKDVVIANASGSFGVSIAEYLLTGTLMLMRHMKTYEMQQKQKVWQGGAPCQSIDKSKVTVVGLGDIGSNFAMRMKALGATVRAVRRTKTDCPAYVDKLYTTDELITAVSDADVVALCLPHTKSTDHMISADVLLAMKPTAYVLNVGRGKTVDEEALIDALQNGRLGGAMLDVTTIEPLPPESPLWSMDNVILTPHVSGRDLDPYNITIIHEIFMDNLKRFLAGQPLTHVVDQKLGY